MADAKNNGYFWNSDNADRVYDADSFSNWLKKFFTTGVFSGDLMVTPAGGMSLSVTPGYCNIEGKVRIFEGASSLTLDPASASYPRIDSVVITCDYTKRSIDIGVLKGSYSGSSPVPADLTRNVSMYQIELAQVTVGAGATTITEANIKDTRMDSSLCGLVTGTVEEINIDGVTKQYAQIFNDWFQNIKDKLSGDTAGNLQNQIDALTAAINAMSMDSVKLSASNSTSDSIKFGIDSNGRYGYIKAGADAVTPFRLGNAKAENVLAGKTFSNEDASGIEGTMPDRGVYQFAGGTGNGNGYYALNRIPAGYYHAEGNDASWGPEIRISVEDAKNSQMWKDSYNLGLANGYNNVNPQISAGNMGVTSISAQITSGRALVFVYFWSSVSSPSDITISSGAYVKLYDGKRNFGTPLYAMKIYKVTGINSGTFTVRANNVNESQCSIGIVSY